MKKPQVENGKLKALVDQLWSERAAAIGDGSTADAIRHEIATGKPVEYRYHAQKGQDYIKALEKWLRSKSSPKSESDRKIAHQIIKDIQAALKGK